MAMASTLAARVLRRDALAYSQQSPRAERAPLDMRQQ